MFKNRAIMDCIPIQITENKGKTFFNVFYKNKERMVDSSRVSGLEVLRDKFVYSFNEPSVVFILKGELARRYSLRENEQILPCAEADCIAVSNRGENKEILFARLLRYDDKCEIQTPKIYREEMRKILDNALSNYGEE